MSPNVETQSIHIRPHRDVPSCNCAFPECPALFGGFDQDERIPYTNADGTSGSQKALIDLKQSWCYCMIWLEFPIASRFFCGKCCCRLDDKLLFSRVGLLAPCPTPNPKDQTLLYSVLSSFTCPVLLKLPGAKAPRLFSSQQEISTWRRAGAFISPWAISIAQRLVGPRKQLRQIIQVNTTMLTAGQPVCYLQAWSRILTRNYQKQSI